MVILMMYLSPIEQDVGLWTTAFATSHIGMSAIRNSIIQILGNFADKQLKIVGRGQGKWQLPDFWPGDNEGGQDIFPTIDIAGRQLYRILYTIVSFGTLGSAFSSYLEALRQVSPPPLELVLSSTPTSDNVFFWMAVLSSAISIASLANPSPLSLVPVFDQQKEQSTDVPPAGAVARKWQRSDDKKLQVTGMTRITRHPLILPVVTWGIGTAESLGGQPRDFLFFGILSIYAICGCLAQDLRVLRQEGSVGTVFAPDTSLQEFFQDTSFFPFGAVVDGRQSIEDIFREVPWRVFILGIGIAYAFQIVLLNWLLYQATTV